MTISRRVLEYILGKAGEERCAHSAQSWYMKGDQMYCEDCEGPIFQAGDGYWYKGTR